MHYEILKGFLFYIYIFLDGWTTDKEQIHFDTLSKLQLPADGEEIELKIVSIVNLNSFYVAFKHWQSYSVSFSGKLKNFILIFC